MHEVNISLPLSLARFFLTQQLICKRKIEKQNFSLDIFVPDTSIARNLHLPGLEKKHFSYIRDFQQITSVITLHRFCPLSNPLPPPPQPPTPSTTPFFLMEKTRLDMESQVKLMKNTCLITLYFKF